MFNFVVIPNVLYLQWLYEILMKREAKCCNGHRIKCWQHYLKDFKIESFVPLTDPKPLHIDNLMVALPNLPLGTIRFRLDWCSELRQAPRQRPLRQAPRQ